MGGKLNETLHYSFCSVWFLVRGESSILVASRRDGGWLAESLSLLEQLTKSSCVPCCW